MKYDVIVVGGGPAGSTAARYCAAAGLETLILEKEYFPRVKTCAGGVTVAALNLLEEPVPPEIVESRCTHFYGFYEDEKVAVDMGQEFMVVVSREIFDMWLIGLAQSAGADFKQGQKVTSIDVCADGVTVRTESAAYCGRIVVGADGVNSAVAKMVRRPLQKNDLGFCLCSEVDAAGYDQNWYDGIEIYYGQMPMSYGWVFPKRGRYSVGLGGWLSGAKNFKEVLERFLQKRGLPLEQEIRGHFVPLGGIDRPTVSDRIILAGDAAGYADPFTGEGIRYAVASGRLAAEAANFLISRGVQLDRQNLGVYERNCYRQFGADLKAALFIARQFGKFPKLLLGIYFRCGEPFKNLWRYCKGK